MGFIKGLYILAVAIALAEYIKGDDLPLNEIKKVFDEFDLDANGHITSGEIGAVMKSLGEEIPGYKLREIIKEVDSNANGTIEFNEFLDIYKGNANKKHSAKFQQLLQRKVNLEVGTTGEKPSQSSTNGARIAFSAWINHQLADDADSKSYLPIDVEALELFEKTKDGIILSKMINLSAPKTIDERAINKGRLNAFKVMENQLLALNSAGAIGCNVVNIGAENLSQGKHHVILDLLWHIIRTGLFANISPVHNPHLTALLKEGETFEDLVKLSPEEILLRWANYQLEKGNSNKRIKNFSADISDSEAYATLIWRIAPDLDIDNPGQITAISDINERAEAVLKNADKARCRYFVRPKDIVAGDPKLNLAFVANLFNHYPALELPEKEEDTKPYAETREEKNYRNWMNSLGVSPYVYHLYSDVSNGLVLFQLYDSVKSGVVDWDKVNGGPFNVDGGKQKEIENGNYTVQLGKQLGFSLADIEGKDIHDGKKTAIQSLVWQMMKAYTVGLLQKRQGGDKPISDAEIIASVNSRLQKSGKQSKIQSFEDPTISKSAAVLDLVDVKKPGVVDYTLVRSGDSDEDKLLNAQYAISLCQKIGARVYALPEDIVEVKPKMVSTIFTSLLTAGSRGSK